MDLEAEARKDVEETLRAGRDALERGVSRGRLGVFAALTMFCALLWPILSWRRLPTALPVPEGESWRTGMPLVVFGCSALYAWLVWWRVSRKGSEPAFAAVTSFADILVVVLSAVVLKILFAPLEDGSMAVLFDKYCLAPILLPLVFLGCLRVKGGLRFVLGAFAVAAYLLGIRHNVTHFEPPQFLAAVMLAVGALLGSKTSDRIGEMLERQSRLSLLRSYLPRTFADRVSSDSIDLRAALEPQALEATLLVADLRSFTAISEKLPPGEVVALLGDYHQAMLEAVEACGGVIDKFLGDGILVVFGLPGPDGKKAPDAGAGPAVRCAAAMLDRLARLNLSRSREGKAPLAAGVGIHTGEVIAGTIGAGRRREFTVIGDAVNTASRLEGLTKTAEAPVLVSASTVARLGRDASQGLRELPPMSVKGKAEPLRIFALERESGLLARPA